MPQTTSTFQLLAPLGYLAAGGALASVLVLGTHGLSGAQPTEGTAPKAQPNLAQPTPAPRAAPQPVRPAAPDPAATRVAAANTSGPTLSPVPAVTRPAARASVAVAAPREAPPTGAALNETRSELTEIKALLMAEREAKADANTAQPAVALAVALAAANADAADPAPALDTALSDAELAEQLAAL